MCMWQSQALAGALRVGASLPVEFGTACWAWLFCVAIAPAAKAAAPLRRIRRSTASWRMVRPPCGQPVDASHDAVGRTSAADLKFLHRLRQTHLGTSNR